MKSKKALVEIVLQPTFVTLLVLGLILTTLLAKIGMLSSDLAFEKKFLASDIGLSIDALQAVPHNAYFLYSGLGKYNLSYSLGPSIIEIFEGKEKGKDSSRGVYYVTEDGPQGVSIDHKDIVPKNKTVEHLYISKSGKEIFIYSPQVDASKATNLKRLNCPNKLLGLNKALVLAIDPGHGWDEANQKGEKGLINTGLNVQESALVLSIAKPLSGLLSRFATIATTRGLDNDGFMPMAQKINNAKQANIIISIHAGMANDNITSNAIAYFNAHSNKKEESVALGCNILNALSDAFSPRIQNIALVPVNVADEVMINPESPYGILLEDKIAVLLELGNIMQQSPNVLFTSQIDISKSIFDGVMNNAGIR